MAIPADTTGAAAAAGPAGAVGEAGVDAASLLGSQVFSPPVAARLLALRGRYQRGEFPHIPIEQKRLEFARWLVQHGRLSDQLDQATGRQQ